VKPFAFATTFFSIQLNHAIAVLETCLWRQGYRKSPFSLLIEGLAEDRTRAACVALSGAKRSANHYDPCLQTYEKQSQSVSNCRNKLYVTSRLLAVIAIFYPALSSATTLPSTGT
jgi:hypothetical protein